MKFVTIFLLATMSAGALAKEINIKVSGMVCSMCVQGIEKKFKALSEVKTVKVDLTNKMVLVQTEGDTDIDDKKISKIINEAGYNVANVERK